MDPKKPAKEIVDLSPKSAEYRQKIDQARGVSHPVGGAPMPKMPNFADAQSHGGDRFAGVQNQQQRRAQGMATLLTPDERTRLEAEGRAIPGVGSAYVANQPAAQRMNAEQTRTGYQNPPRPEGAGLSESTTEQLAAVAKANSPEAKAEADAEQMKKDLDDLEDEVFDYDEFGNKVKNLLANKERKKAIESRCEPMDLMDLLVNKEVRQVVPIIPGKYYPTFRTMGGDEDLEVKRLIAGEKNLSTEFILSKMTLMNLTCGLYAINGKMLPSHQGKDGEFVLESFKAKFEGIIRYPMQLLADLAVNYTWFDRRVRSLIAVDDIKGF